MKRVLVMGGSYFIGKKIVDTLKKTYDITVLNRGNKKIDDDITHIECDRNDRKNMISVLKDQDFDIIIDVSCLNGEQAEILVESIKTEKLQRIIFISSSAVYNVEKLSPPFKENDPLGYNKYWKEYGWNKIQAESVYKRFSERYLIPVIALRPPYVYGENNYAQRESFIFDHIENKQTIILPKLDFKLQFIYSGDLANIVTVLIESENIVGYNVFNVGNKKPVSVSEWVEMCFEVVGRKTNVFVYDYINDNRKIRDFFPFHDYDNYLDVTLINEICQKEISMQSGLLFAYNWYRDNKNEIEFKKEIRENEIDILSKV